MIKKRKIGLLGIVSTMVLAAYASTRLGSAPLQTGKLQDKSMNEISGIAASAVNPDLFYVHNDSGDSSRFFAIDVAGNLKATYKFKGVEDNGLGVLDCEDIAVGPGLLKNKSYIYLGDIGDNGGLRNSIVVYRFAEPKLGKGEVNINADALHLKYPDGAKDAETLMADPVEKLLYIVSKRKDSVSVYTTPLNFKTNDTVILTKRCTLFFTGFAPLKWITAGDISADGRQIILKNYVNVYYWKRAPGVPVWKAMMDKPQELNYKQEKQGEAIGFLHNGSGYLTTSEGVAAPIFKYTF